MTYVFSVQFAMKPKLQPPFIWGSIKQQNLIVNKLHYQYKMFILFVKHYRGRKKVPVSSFFNTIGR